MRDKQLLPLFLALNVALGGCFVVYLILSSNRHPQVVATSFPVPAAKGAGTNAAALAATNPAPAALPTNALAAAVAAEPGPVLSRTNFNWENLETPAYSNYLASLRAVGCPEDKVRYILLADINELFARKRREEAKARDMQWWKSEPDIMIANVLQQKGRMLEDERRAMIERFLGGEALENEKAEALPWSNVQLTGEVLGSLPTDVHNTVQEICARSIDRHQGAFWARINEGGGVNPVELARLRETTRTDLRRVLNAEQLEEFLLRYSHNAQNLRNTLRGFDPTPEEFRKVFRAIDAIDHQLQLEYGGMEALSQQQRERYERQRDAAIRDALGPQRFEQYLVTKDPLYQQAQMVARQYGASAKAILPLYQMNKANEAKRQKILGDATMSPQQKSMALNAVNMEQMQTVQRIVTEAGIQQPAPVQIQVLPPVQPVPPPPPR